MSNYQSAIKRINGAQSALEIKRAELEAAKDRADVARAYADAVTASSVFISRIAVVYRAEDEANARVNKIKAQIAEMEQDHD